jgi:protein phosphatase
LHQYGAGTDVGNVRDNNEDSFVCDTQKELWIVADGMGGLGFGEVASAITTFTVTTLVREGHGVNQAIELAHSRIKEYAETDGLGTNMGTTIVLLLSHGSLYNIFWVGDSRAYLFDQGTMKQVTIDHSLVQNLIDQGELTKEEAEFDPRKNAVTRALGVQELDTVRADSVSERWQPGQKILLCSDGLTDCVRDHDIESIMSSGGTDQEIVDRLVEAALEGGGKDNVTVIVVSAPETARSTDSDTHVPGAVSDDTQIPRYETFRLPVDSSVRCHGGHLFPARKRKLSAVRSGRHRYHRQFHRERTRSCRTGHQNLTHHGFLC